MPVDSEEQSWFKWAHLGKYLGIEDIWASLNGLEKCEILSRQDLVLTQHSTLGWSGPKDQENKTVKFLLAFGVIYVIVKSQKDKGKALKKHILKDIVPCGFDARIENLTSHVQALEFTNEEERQAQQQQILRFNKDHRRTIEEKDAGLALLNDDLQNREYENVALPAQRDVYKDQLQKCQDIITHFKARYVDHAKDSGKDNNVMIIEKNATPEEDEFYEYPCYIARIKRRFINTKRRWFKAKYPHHRFITEEQDNANGIHPFNRFEEERFVERFQCHFRLVDIPRDALYALTTPAIQE